MVVNRFFFGFIMCFNLVNEPAWLDWYLPQDFPTFVICSVLDSGQNCPVCFSPLSVLLRYS